MPELAYPEDHFAHPANKGKKMPLKANVINTDHPANHPARGGQGQPVPIEGGSDIPRDGFKHLYGMTTGTLADAQHSFSLLPEDEQAARMKWNIEGVPVPPEESE